MQLINIFLLQERRQMKLLIDVGNSKTKMGIWNYGRLLNVSLSETKNILKNISNYKTKRINGIYITSVISSKENKKIITYIEKNFKIKPHQIKSTKSMLGVNNGYIKPTKLGDDRWCTIVGLYKLYKKPLLIVDSGTAITLDCVNNNGKHLGGYILSGSDGYQSSFTNSYNLKSIKLKNINPIKKFKPSKSTDEAILEGYVLMVTSAIEKLYKNFSAQQTKKPLLIIGGGYGQIISKRLSIKNKYEPNLVLRCLGLIANHYSSRRRI